MLEKAPGEIYINKLYAILLLKADFNALHKIIFNSRVLLSLEARDQVLREIIEEKLSQSAI